MKRLSPAVAILWLAIATPMLYPAEEQVLQQVSANGSRNLRPFTAKDHWEIRWDNKGSFLSISVRNSEGRPVSGGGSQQGAGSGESYQPKGGTYYLDVTGTGEWTVTVVQLP